MCFKWEFRVAYLGVLGLPFYFGDTIFLKISHYIWLVCVFTVLVTDSIVPVMLMIVFLRPIMDTLNMAAGFVQVLKRI